LEKSDADVTWSSGSIEVTPKLAMPALPASDGLAVVGRIR
jgi:hypothetical protein